MQRSIVVVAFWLMVFPLRVHTSPPLRDTKSDCKSQVSPSDAEQNEMCVYMSHVATVLPAQVTGTPQTFCLDKPKRKIPYSGH